ncbi:unnamed protein product [Heligmosomoides polygyrus]|uniref:Transthyretin-like family protein n=1 Tax=Heligmosomoides polygyrus TaxID=6339 RepID=A0A183GBK8_HELPZ|nr:unnamed protein product [Heligmosomoides polygyrus]
MALIKVLLLLSAIALSSDAFRMQSVAVKGKLMCGSQPAANVQVKLLDEDQGDPDDTLDNVFTKSDGAFRVSGSASELTPIDPEVRIYHDCNDHGKVTFITFEKFLLEEDEKTVRGVLKCGSTPAKDVQVKLIDDDFGPDPDDVLDSGYTDAKGFFELAGSTAERTTIDPHLKFYHDCNDGITVSSCLSLQN